VAKGLGILCLRTALEERGYCPETALIETGSDEHAAVLACMLPPGRDGDLHHDTLDGLWWRADEGRDDA
jgi:hypothetical protein